MPDQQLALQTLTGTHEGTTILRLSGPLTLSTMFGFQTAVREDRSPKLILELSGVPYIDSAGIGCLVGAHVSRQNRDRSVALVGLNSRVRTALEVTRVAQLFTIYDSEAEAQAKLNGR